MGQESQIGIQRGKKVMQRIERRGRGSIAKDTDGETGRERNREKE